MEEEKGTITIKKNDLWKYSTFVLLAVVVIGAFFMLSGKSTTGNVVADPNPLPAVDRQVDIDLGDAPILGNENAEITLVEFSDYECPFCGRHYSQTYQQIKTNYVDTGKVRVAFMNFPLSFHPNAQKAAEAAECAGEQGKYWEMHDKLYENQQSLSVENYKIWAAELGLNSGQFGSCLDSSKYAQNVQDDFKAGQEYGVQGTPGFFINGRAISGACPYTTFDQAFKAEMDGEKWAVTNCQFALI